MDYRKIDAELSQIRAYFRKKIKDKDFQSMIGTGGLLRIVIDNYFNFFFERIDNGFFQKMGEIDLHTSFNEDFDQIFQNEYEKIKKNNTYRKVV